MSNPNPSKSTRFQAGTSGNPSGSSQRARTSGAIARIKSSELCELGTVLLRGTMADIEATKDDAKASVLQCWLASLISQGIINNDVTIFRAVLDRVVGKPRNESITTIETSDPSLLRIEAMTHEEKLVEAERLRDLRLEIGDD